MRRAAISPLVIATLGISAALGALSSCANTDVAKVNDSTRASTGAITATVQSDGDRPDEAPALVTSELPFKYPAALYARRVQGNVTLKLFVDRDGHVVTDSTRVEEPSGYPALDTAALAGSTKLRFVPAKAHGEPTALAILFPVYFRHPEARPLPGDSILKSGKSG
jgi:TonB family protein